MRSDVGRRCQRAPGGGRCGVEWPLPPSPAGPREVRAGASRPPLRPRARGRRCGAGPRARAAGTPAPPPGSPPSRLSSSSPAPGGAATRRAPRRTCGAGTAGGPRAPVPGPALAAVRPRALRRVVSGAPQRAGGRAAGPPTSGLLRGPPPRAARHPGRLPGRDCAPAPRGGVLTPTSCPAHS